MKASLHEIIANYDGFIVDLWGVMHDGDRLYPGAAETLRVLYEMNKPVLFLSNAPRVATKAEQNLERLGIPRAHYLSIVTSGQVAHDMLAQSTIASPPAGEATRLGEQRKPSRSGEGASKHEHHKSNTPSPNPLPQGERAKVRPYYYLGPSKDEEILADLPQFQKTDESAAQFILCTGYEYDTQPHEEILPLLAQLLHLPMLCVNPDMEVVKQDGTEWLCAGRVAAQFSGMGGRVSYIGKPFPEVYGACKRQLGSLRTLCVGDNPITDIKGANDAGYDSLLITGGVMKARYGDSLTEADAREVCRIAGVTPTYVLSGFGM
jgi:HAD superfamily hydrolase (TIGR01450 family)